MEKEKRITAPEGCEIEKVEIIDGVAVVTFKHQDRKLPKSWDEFCEMFHVQGGECYINDLSEIKNVVTGCVRGIERDESLLPDRATAEAIIALCQLIQLRNAYNGEWGPDWNDISVKYTLEFEGDKIIMNFSKTFPQILYFKTGNLRNEFQRNFSPLIEKLKPLYGFKEGGEK